MNIKAYESQKQLVGHVRSAINIKKAEISQSKLILYNTMVGAGKTCLVLALTNLIRLIN